MVKKVYSLYDNPRILYGNLYNIHINYKNIQ